MKLQTIEDVKTHLFSEISRYGSLETHAILEEQDGRYCFIIFTDRNEYRIGVCLPGEDKPQGYLGCIAQARKPRAGECWRRGNDLPDGPLTYETWRCILAGIVSYEMVKIHKQPEYQAAQGISPQQ